MNDNRCRVHPGWLKKPENQPVVKKPEPAPVRYRIKPLSDGTDISELIRTAYWVQVDGKTCLAQHQNVPLRLRY